MNGTTIIAISGCLLIIYLTIKRVIEEKKNDPFKELEYRNQLSDAMFDDIEKYSDPMEKLVKGMEYIYGPKWYGGEEVVQTQTQIHLTSLLLTIVLYNSLRGTMK